MWLVAYCVLLRPTLCLIDVTALVVSGERRSSIIIKVAANCYQYHLIGNGSWAGSSASGLPSVLMAAVKTAHVCF